MIQIVEQRFTKTSKATPIQNNSNPNYITTYDNSDNNMPEEMNPNYIRPREDIKATEKEIFERIWFSRNNSFSLGFGRASRITRRQN